MTGFASAREASRFERLCEGYLAEARRRAAAARARPAGTLAAEKYGAPLRHPADAARRASAQNRATPRAGSCATAAMTTTTTTTTSKQVQRIERPTRDEDRVSQPPRRCPERRAQADHEQAT